MEQMQGELATGDPPGSVGLDLAYDALEGARLLAHEARGGPAALLLRCAAARLLVRGALAREGLPIGGRGLDPESWTRFTSLRVATEPLARLSDDERRLVRESFLGPQGPRRIPEDSHGRASLARALARFCEPLARELRREAQEVAARSERRRPAWIAAAAAAVLLASALSLVLARGRRAAGGPENVALGRAATVHGELAVTDRAAPGLTDHDRDQPALRHSLPGRASAVVDLVRPTTIRRLVAYHRTDCCQHEAESLTVGVSSDGRRFVEVARREQAFDFWVADFSPVTARAVRLTAEQGGLSHVTEIEIY